jgi:hypothetical protein
VLPGLALKDVLAEVGGRWVALTELGERLRGDVPGSIKGRSWSGASSTTRPRPGCWPRCATGGTAFEQVHGDRFFDYLGRHPAKEAAFQGSMAGRSEQEADA